MYKIYTDGSCLKNPNGPGGWCFVLIDNDHDWIMSDGDPSTTNNRMELKAVIESLKMIKEKESCIIYSDSKLVINCATGIWKRNKNLDLWKEYDIISKNKIITYEWVKGHSGNKYNEIVDKFAKEEAEKIKLK